MDSSIIAALRVAARVDREHPDRKRSYLDCGLDVCEILERSGWDSRSGRDWSDVYVACLGNECIKDDVLVDGRRVCFELRVDWIFDEIPSKIDGSSGKAKKMILSDAHELYFGTRIFLLTQIMYNVECYGSRERSEEDVRNNVEDNTHEMCSYLLWARTVGREFFKIEVRYPDDEGTHGNLCRDIEDHCNWLLGNSEPASLDWYYSLKTHKM